MILPLSKLELIRSSSVFAPPRGKEWEGRAQPALEPGGPGFKSWLFIWQLKTLECVIHPL